MPRLKNIFKSEVGSAHEKALKQLPVEVGAAYTDRQHGNSQHNTRNSSSTLPRGADNWRDSKVVTFWNTLTRQSSTRTSKGSLDSGFGGSTRRSSRGSKRSPIKSTQNVTMEIKDGGMATEPDLQAPHLSLVLETHETCSPHKDVLRIVPWTRSALADPKQSVNPEAARKGLHAKKLRSEDEGEPQSHDDIMASEVMLTTASEVMPTTASEVMLTTASEEMLKAIRTRKDINNNCEINQCNKLVKEGGPLEKLGSVLAAVDLAVKEDLRMSPDNCLKKQESIRDKMKPYMNKSRKPVAKDLYTSTPKISANNISAEIPIVTPKSPDGSASSMCSPSVTAACVQPMLCPVSQACASQMEACGLCDASQTPKRPAKRRRKDLNNDDSSIPDHVVGLNQFGSPTVTSAPTVEDSDGKFGAFITDLLREIPNGQAKDELKAKIHTEAVKTKYSGPNKFEFIVNL